MIAGCAGSALHSKIKGPDMITIRRARSQDAQTVWDLRNVAIQCQCEGHYPAEDLAIWTAGAMTEPFVEAVRDKFHVATLEKGIVATGAVDLETAKVDAIFVAPDHMRTGIGRQGQADTLPLCISMLRASTKPCR